MDKLTEWLKAMHDWIDVHRKASAVIAGFLVGVVIGAIMF